MKVAIAGARGIGRYHAQWFHREGCSIVGYTARTPANLIKAEALLKTLIPLNARGYLKIEEMLAREKPDILVIATPPETHYDYCMAAFNHGVHVFCEKPLMWDKKKSTQKILANTRALFSTANKKKIILGVNTQYVTALDSYNTLCAEISPSLNSRLNSFYFELESRGSGSRLSDDDLWIDIASHPLSMLLALMPKGDIDVKTIRKLSTAKSLQVNFVYGNINPCNVEIIYRITDSNHLTRRFGINNVIVDYGGWKNDLGTYKSILKYKDRYVTDDDFMQQSIRKFISAVRTNDTSEMLTSQKQIYKNMELHAQVYDSLYMK